MKRLFIFLAVVMVAAVAWGQKKASSDSRVYVPAKKSDTRSMTRASESGQVWWCNYDADPNADWYFVTMGETGETGHFNVATFIPANLVGGSGTNVKGISLFPISPAMTNIKVWVSKTLPASDGEADLETKAVSAKLEEFNDCVFDNSYEIPSEGLYVGYSYDIANSTADYWDRPVLCTDSPANRDGALWVMTPSTSWEKRYGNLLVNVLFEGSLYTNMAEPTYFETTYTEVNGVASVPVTITNYGANEISSISYTLTSGSSVSEETSIGCNIPSFSSSVVNISIPGEATSGEASKTFTLTKVNGEDNTYSNTSVTGKVITLSFIPTPVPVMEEYTGTWCGWCPRGMVALGLINETYGDKVITIAAHNSDPMAFSPYSNMAPGGFPSAEINRGGGIDPYYDRGLLETALATIVPGEISATATWADKDQTTIDITTQTRFGMGSSSSPFSIAYVLVEDGLTGTSSDWAQSNYYSGRDYSDDPNLQPLTTQPSRITGLEFDHVAVAGWGIENGVDGSIPESFNDGETLNYLYKADISSNTIIQDKSKLHVVVLLLDRSTGKIINAAKTTITTASDACFKYEGEKLENDGWVEIGSQPDSFFPDEKNCMTNDPSDPSNGLFLVASPGSSVSATLEIVSNTLNPSRIQWCMGGVCELMNDKSTLTKSFTVGEDGSTPVEFDASNIGEDGKLEAKLTATIGGKDVTVNIRFLSTSTNIGNVPVREKGDAKCYDLNGRPYRTGNHGVYIINGKKHINNNVSK